MTTIKGKHVKDKDQIKYMKIRNDELEFLDKVSGHLKECTYNINLQTPGTWGLYDKYVIQQYVYIGASWSGSVWGCVQGKVEW